MGNTRKDKMAQLANKKTDKVEISEEVLYISNDKGEMTEATDNHSYNETQSKKIKVNMLLSELEHFAFQIACRANKEKMQVQLKEIAMKWTREQAPFVKRATGITYEI